MILCEIIYWRWGWHDYIYRNFRIFIYSSIRNWLFNFQKYLWQPDQYQWPETMPCRPQRVLHDNAWGETWTLRWNAFLRFQIMRTVPTIRPVDIPWRKQPLSKTWQNGFQLLKRIFLWSSSMVNELLLTQRFPKGIVWPSYRLPAVCRSMLAINRVASHGFKHAQ